jgi:hypothetical protein
MFQSPGIKLNSNKKDKSSFNLGNLSGWDTLH